MLARRYQFYPHLPLIQYELHWAVVKRVQGKLLGLLLRLRMRLVSMLKEKRPGRTCGRVVKSKHRHSIVRVLKKSLSKRHCPSFGAFLYLYLRFVATQYVLCIVPIKNRIHLTDVNHIICIYQLPPKMQ